MDKRQTALVLLYSILPWIARAAKTFSCLVARRLKERRPGGMIRIGQKRDRKIYILTHDADGGRSRNEGLFVYIIC